MASLVRSPAVAGQFYPGRADVLLRDIREYTSVETEKHAAIGCVVPHAGYMYSGHVAGALYASLELPKRYVILCPNHTGVGAPLAIMSEGGWETPLGEVPIDSQLALALKEKFSLLAEDPLAHQSEHALEVQLPFLQALENDFAFVPIAVGTSRLDVLQALGKVISKSIQSIGESAMVIASSDMNHYENDSVTRVKDHKAIDRILALDPEGLHETIQREHITMCGYGPAVVMLTAAKAMGATKADLVKYATSGDVSGDKDWVVGYAGIAVR
ncbi:MAG: AmmeMemoRadiSam system protein B [Acidobacteriaceae bacterium]